MSGIFKSVKKVFSSIGKFIKKYWKPIVLAAAAYFGGAYLMSSMGGAGAGAAASVGTSVTHAGQVWRNALSSMLSGGNALDSASAYANAVYKAKDLAVSSQVMAGTNSVQVLKHFRNNAGISNFTSEHIADASELGYQSVLSGLKVAPQGTEAVTQASMEYLNSELMNFDTARGVEMLDLPVSGEIEGIEQLPDEWQAGDRSVAQLGDAADIQATFDPTADPLAAQASVASGTDIDPGGDSYEDYTSTGGENITDVPQVVAQVLSPEQKVINDLFTSYFDKKSVLEEAQLEAIKQQAGVNKLALGMKGVGLLLSAFGEREKAKASERVRTKTIPEEWKKSGVPGIDWKGIKF